jgi:peptidoglycan/xylan/chitin deacetylase (PgdA/CDA1 family)
MANHTPQELVPTTSTIQRRPTRVAVPADTPAYWIDALHRSGLFVARGGPTTAAKTAFVPPESSIPDAELRAMHAAGLAIVGDGRVADVLCGVPCAPVRLQGIRGTGPLFAGCETIRMPAIVRTTASRVTLDTDGAAPVLALPLPTATTLLAATPALHGFPAAESLHVHEFVSGSDHGGVRRLLRNALRLVQHLQGETFATLEEFPSGCSGAIGIRIDADDFDAAATATVVDSLERARFRATWFIDVERHEDKGGRDAVLGLADRGDEVQSHFYHHYTYRSAERNRRNLARSRSVLREWGIEATAAATPFGSFHGGVLAAVRAEGLDWTSEFSANYDDLPSSMHGSAQIPVHPVCPILLLQAGLSVDAVHKYYTDRLREHLSVGESTIFYGHPIRDLGAVPELFLALRAILTEHEARTGFPVWQPTLGEFKAFHDRRRRHLEDGRLDDSAPGVRLDHPPGGAPRTPPVQSTCDTWNPGAQKTLRRLARNIRFRRWLREFRNRTKT